MSDRIEKLSEELIGTCKSLHDLIDPDTMTQAEFEELDSLAMLCDECGWWEPAEEIDEEGICIECQEGR